ncbi:dTDP-4-dehydrorhamnose 3,5-epimerase [Candidatus Uhrbacteria bacterium]|nr:dTDP-4-dehydrorhamnose 3,5-epimerase [Candidatus Uhrbacteria bacterium]
MTYTETPIPGVLILEPQIFSDERGYFFETFREDEFFEKTGVHFVQENQSWSKYGILRGMHFQREPHAQAKLVRVLSGIVLDVVIDIRKNSPTYGRHIAVELSAENKKQLFVPTGCAHGFLVLSREGADFFYKCSAYYHKESEGGIRFDDPALGIDWRLPREEIIVAERDLAWPPLSSRTT